MEYEILCGKFKELYGENNDYGLFRDMTDIEKSNMMKNFEGGAFFSLKGLNPFNKHDFYTTSAAATQKILESMKPWDDLSPKQQKMIFDYCVNQHKKNDDDSHLSADMVMFFGVKNKQFVDRAIALSDDGLPIQLEMTEKGRRVYRAPYGKQALDVVVKQSKDDTITHSNKTIDSQEQIKNLELVQEARNQSGLSKGLAQAEQQGDVQEIAVEKELEKPGTTALQDSGQMVSVQEEGKTDPIAQSTLSRA